MDQIKSQLLGISLAIATAIGCIAYEKVVKNHSLGVILFLTLLFYVPVLIFLIYFSKGSLTKEILSLTNDTKILWASIIYSITFITTPIWYIITKKQGVLVGSIYEIKYLVILVVFYIFFGDGKFTNNTMMGFMFAMLSMYFISK